MSDLLIQSRHGRAAVVQFNRADKRNALSSELLAALGDCLSALDEDDDVRGVVLTGDERAFSAGADLGGALKAQSPRATARLLSHFAHANEVIDSMSKPVVAAINGYCLTGARRGRGREVRHHQLAYRLGGGRWRNPEAAAGRR